MLKKWILLKNPIIYLLGLFYFISAISFFYSDFQESSFRFFLGSILVVFYIIVSFQFLVRIGNDFNRVIDISLKLYLLSSLLYYLLGVSSFSILQEHQFIYGIFVEKSLPRLVGFTIDPNFAALTFCFSFFFYFNGDKNLKFSRIFIFLSLILLLLTLSRGGVITLLVVLLITNVNKITFRTLFLTIVMLFITSIILFVINYFSLIDLVTIFEKRLAGSSTGAGRFNIWKNAFELYTNAPLFGTGIFTFRHYNAIFFNTDLYAHNTFLEILVELGSIGFTVFFLIFLLMTLYSFKMRFYCGYLLPSILCLFIMSLSLSLYLNSIFAFFILVFSVVYYNFWRVKN